MRFAEISAAVWRDGGVHRVSARQVTWEEFTQEPTQENPRDRSAFSGFLTNAVFTSSLARKAFILSVGLLGSALESPTSWIMGQRQRVFSFLRSQSLWAALLALRNPCTVRGGFGHHAPWIEQVEGDPRSH